MSKRPRVSFESDAAGIPQDHRSLHARQPPSTELRIGSHAATWQRTHGDYTIAWNCALPIELETSRLMLDEEHGHLDAIRGDDNSYICGRIAAHDIVMTVLPGAYDKVNAAVVATKLKRSFPNIQATLMVGVGGAAPARTDLRLGDGVVGIRVMQYDLGKDFGHGDFRASATPAFPSKMLVDAIANLRSSHGTSQSPEKRPQRVQSLLDTKLSTYPRPGQPDLLFRAAYRHIPGADTYEKCDRESLQPRAARGHADKPLIHYGGIGSGDQVKKDAIERDKVAGMFDLLCFEMEAAGVIETMGCLPIRGICGYSDSHKNKVWQAYATASATAYARELVETLQPLVPRSLFHATGVDSGSLASGPRPVDKHDTLVDNHGAPTEKRRAMIRLLKFPDMDNRHEAIHPELHKTCVWFLEHPKYQQWAERDDHTLPGREFLWTRGKAGTGKSTMMKFLFSRTQREKARDITAAFFFNARSPQYLEKSTQGMYRSLLVQIIRALPALRLTDHAKHSGPPGPNSLKAMFQHVVAELRDNSLVCFVDALDECDEQEVTEMVSFFEDLAEIAVENGTCFRVLLSSRPYPYIKIDEDRLITLENEKGHTRDLKQYVEKRLRVSQAVEVELREKIMEKASGIYMWVVLVVGILNEEAKNNGGWTLHKRLSELPSDLSQLFKEILSRDTARPNQLRRCVL